ncbi:hypothetical protein WICPIJ_004695 [Wickerhamomyces pijperi]|uniref:Golgi to ER traffic protein 2 n=1 Tax=Wickerhamomyces pijperi TaxID=599730 RepID=A0A9P8Q728_WICPI|nr:hypothetical protein WICPIJ_004695 [Wickerhamomyces pijperi]
MSTLTEAEKRKLLRERRAAKVKNGSSRLNKITGDYSIPEPTNPIPVEAEDIVPELKPQVFKNSTSATQKKSNRISQAFDDPEVEDISKFLPTRHQQQQKQQPNSKVNQEEAEEFQKALQQLLSSQQHQHENGSDPLANPFGGDGQFDFLQQMLGAAGGAGGAGSPFGDLLKGFGGPSGTNGNATGEGQSDSDFLYKQELLAYNKEVNDQYKAITMLTRFSIAAFLALIFHFEDNSVLNLLESLSPSANSLFLQVFISFEVIATITYALRLFKLSPGEYNYDFKVLGYLDYVPDAYLSQSLKSKIKLMMRYLELGKLILFDFAAIIVLGVFLKVLFG